MKKIAILEAEFDTDIMIRDEDLKEFWDNDWLKFMKNRYEDESIGLFDEIKLVGIKEEQVNMSEEIKKIKDKLEIIIRNDFDYLLRTHDCKILLDYITNLQQIEQEHQKLNGELRKKNKDYKSRIDKAIEYIENEKNKQNSVGVYTKNIHKNLLKILKGDEE